DLYADPEERRILARKLEKKGELRNAELALKRKDGRQVIVLENARAVHDEQGKALYYEGTLTDITERKRMEEVLRDRIKELNCFYNISYLVEKPGTSLEEIFQWAVNLIPPAWQYPEITCARIIAKGQGFKTENFRETAWTQDTDIVVHGKPIGTLKVCYLEERPEMDEGPFLKEERSLLNAIASRLGKIIERREAEEALQESEERYRDSIELAPDAIITLDMKGMITSCNTAAANLSDFSKDEIIGKHFSKLGFLREKDIPKYIELFVSTIAGKIFEPFEIMWYHKDGTARLGEVRFSVIEEDDNVVGIQTIVRDITERKEMEEALKESEEKFRSIVENSHSGILILDENYKFIYLNDVLCQISGYSHEELISHDFREFLDDKSRDLITDRYIRRQRGEEVPIQYEFNIIRKDGEKRRVELSSTVIKDSKGKMKTVAQLLDITERKKAEKALRESKNKIEQLHKVAAQMETCSSEEEVYQLIIDAAKGILKFTACSVNIVDGDRLETRATSYDEIPEDRYMSINEGIIGRTYRTGKSYLIDDIRKDKDAKPSENRFQSCVSIPVWSIGAFVTISDKLNAFTREDLELGELLMSHATEALKRIYSEKEIRFSEAKFRGLFENVLDGMYQSTPDGKIISANPALVRMLGYDSEADLRAIDIAYDLYADPEERKILARKLEEEGELRNAELALKRKDGRQAIVLENARAVRDEQGRALYYEGTLTDITERKRMEESLREREQRYRALLERTNDAVFIISLDQKHIEVNQQAADMLGYEIGELIDMSVKEVVAPGEYPDSQRVYKMLMAGEIVPIYQRFFRKKDGTIFPVELNVAMVYDAEDKPLHIQSVARDITERKKSEELLKKQKEELSAFTYTVSHNLKNYITIIQSYARFLLLKKEGAKENTQKIIDVTKKMNEFVTRQLELADAGRAIGEPKEVDLNTVVDEIGKMYSIEIHPEYLPTITGDPRRLREVFNNLIDNAIKHGGADRIEISSEKKKNSYVICVKDNGRGIPKEDIDKIFDIWYSKTGTGFGLAIVKKIVEAHGGSISVKSEEGKGTIFEIVLPKM
ncbi:MAG: PAS domain S-box protein, partial [Methanomicrobia archaeon]|nr:PAS domain S-box protein [Methanomicrobia archaeon]